MDEHNISVEEVMKITHKGRDWILNAIERGTFPGSITISSCGRRSAHIPRKAFWDYMENDHVSVDGEYLEEASRRIVEKALNEFMPLIQSVIQQEIKKAVAGTTTNKN